MPNEIVRTRAVSLAVLAGAALATLVGCGRPASLAAADDPTRGLVEAAAWTAWALAGYLLITVMAAAAACAFRASTAASARWIPRSVRRLVESAIGLTLVAAPMAAASAAAAAPGTFGHAGSPLEWPGLTSARPAATVVVHPGDSLWSIAAASLPEGSRASDVARAWPVIYQANRALIGPDPGLLRPGEELTIPTAGGMQ
jgi:nucleoid-associated protein YgaU